MGIYAASYSEGGMSELSNQVTRLKTIAGCRCCHKVFLTVEIICPYGSLELGLQNLNKISISDLFWWCLGESNSGNFS